MGEPVFSQCAETDCISCSSFFCIKVFPGFNKFLTFTKTQKAPYFILFSASIKRRSCVFKQQPGIIFPSAPPNFGGIFSCTDIYLRAHNGCRASAVPPRTLPVHKEKQGGRLFFCPSKEAAPCHFAAQALVGTLHGFCQPLCSSFFV